MRLFGRRFNQWDVEAGTDSVLFGYPIPAGGKLNNVHLEVHVIGPEGVTYQGAVAYGLTGFVVPVPDPDEGATFDVLWDRLIPKDVPEAAAVFDLDSGAQDITAEWEIAEPDWSGVFNMTANAPLEIFRRRKFLTLATSSIGYEKVDAAADKYTPTDFFKTKVGKRVRVKSPSVVLFGASSPNLASGSTGQESAPSEIQWTLLQYLETTLTQAFMNLIGLTEAGSETPWEESSQFIASLIEKSHMEAGPSAFIDSTFRFYSNVTFDISVPGEIGKMALTSE